MLFRSLPDFAYLRDAPGGIDAVVLTHGHEDHIGALPYVMREIGVREVWGTRLTLGMVKSKLDEHGLLRDAEFIEIDSDGDPVTLQVGQLQLPKTLTFDQFTGKDKRLANVPLVALAKRGHCIRRDHIVQA